MGTLRANLFNGSENDNTKEEERNTEVTTHENASIGLRFQDFWAGFWSRLNFHFGSSTDETSSTTQTTMISDIHVHERTSEKVQLGWTSLQSFVDVTVYYSTTSPVIINSSSTLSEHTSAFRFRDNITLSGLQANTKYYFIVVSKNRHGESRTSTEGSFTTQVK
jgi:hypothetical protein